jgi:LPXTG-site transpeptidase (sortase) family protein
MLKNIIKNKLYLVGIILIISGAVIFTAPFIINKEKDSKEEEYINKYIESTKDTNEEPIESQETTESEQKDIKSINYSMVVEIPRLSLKKGLYDVNSTYNNIDYNIAILPESDMPNITNGTLILASHNGNSVISYFRNLSKLSNSDDVFIYYQVTKYTYKITSYYEAQKTGSIVIKTETNQTSIVLISCKPNTHNMQIVFIGELSNKENY